MNDKQRLLAVMMEEGERFEKIGQMDAAFKTYDEVVRWYPDVPDGYIARVRLLIRQEGTWTAKAISDLEIALRIDPQNIKAGALYVGLGRCYETAGDLKGAFEAFNQAIARKQQLDAHDAKAAYLGCGSWYCDNEEWRN